MDQGITMGLIDRIDEGIILLDEGFKIVAFNDKAQRITGIKLSSTVRHAAGKLVPGDLVVFITNALGEDDGTLNAELLSKLGILGESFKQGDIVMGVGFFETKGFKGLFKHAKSGELTDNVISEMRFVGRRVILELDQQKHVMRINIDGQVFEQSYLKTYGHMVVMDGKDGVMKFYQDKGYTARREAIGDLLRGGTFRAKGTPDESGLPLINQSLDTILESEELFKTLGKMIENAHSEMSEKLYLEMNQRPVYCEIVKFLESPQSLRLLIKFRDLSEMRELLSERESILENIEALRTTLQMVPNPQILEQFDALIGQSSEMIKVKFLAHRATQIMSNVLITGESGTGKTLLAQLIHRNSGLKGGFVEVNCAAIPSTLFESELFGYEKGAFTGADQKGKKGFFEQAENGTLFLDEIGDLPQEIQVKLLQALQSRQFYKLGASTPTIVSARIITATNRILYDAVKAGVFRQDLFYRINVFPIHLPPLRTRQEDLFIVVKQIMNRLSRQMGMSEKQISQEAFALLRNHIWPGNIRELENVLERALAVCMEDTIDVSHLSLSQESGLSVQDVGERTLRERLNEFERATILETILNSENHHDAMLSLGLSKSTFYDKLKRYDIKL